MSLATIGLGAIMAFQAQQAITGMAAVNRATLELARSQNQLASTTNTLRAGFGRLGAGATTLGATLLPATGAFAAGLKSAAEFEKQMDAVGAVTNATGADFVALETKAKQLGATTVFTATEIGGAMEELARAGASTQETLAGISGVAAAAAADSIPLARAADIIAQVTRGMGLEFKEANRVADILALTSAQTNSTIVSLGESFKYASAQSRSMKIPLEDTAVLLGAVADSGLRGSIGGTSFVNMLVKLADPSEKAAAWLAANNIEMTKLESGGLNVADIIGQVSRRLSGMKDVMQKSAITTELFGLRGQKAFNAIEASIQSGRLPQLFDEISRAEGSAARMAERRLSNLLGAVTLFKSALEGFAIETIGMFLEPMAASLAGITKQFAGVVQVLQLLNSGQGNDRKALDQQFGSDVVSVALGIRDAITLVRTAWIELANTIRNTITAITGQAAPDLVQSIAKWATILFFVAAAVGPVLVAFGGLAFFVAYVVVPAIGAIGTAFSGVAGVLGSATIPVILAVLTLFALLRNEGESFGSTMMRIWNAITSTVLWFYENALLPIGNAIASAIMPIVEQLRARWTVFTTEAKNSFQQWFGGVIRAVEYLGPLFRFVFELLGTIVGQWVKFTLLGFSYILKAVSPILNIVKEIGLFILTVIVDSLRTLAHLAVGAADALGLGGSSLIAALAEFSSQPRFDAISATGRIANIEAAQGLGATPPTAAAPAGDLAETTAFAKEASDIAAIQKGAMTKPPPVDVNVNLEDKRKLEIENCVTLDGRNVAIATAKHKQEINERAGFRATPWQRRQIVEQGAAPVGGLGGGQ